MQTTGNPDSVAREGSHDPRNLLTPRVPPLQPGDVLGIEEFERRCRALPEKARGECKLELIDGVAFVAPPPPGEDFHRHPQFVLANCVGHYAAATTGVRGGEGGTFRLDAENQVRPDVHLRLLSAYGGRARTIQEGLVEGAPEFVAEVAASAAGCELHQKAAVYARCGVREYFVWCVYDESFTQLVLAADGRYEPAAPVQKVHRSRVFPGLWLDPVALLQGDVAAAVAAVQNGLASPEHRAFVEELAARKSS